MGRVAPGSFVLEDNRPLLVLDAELVEWTRGGYGQRRARPDSGAANVMTPPSTIAVLLADYPVQIGAAAST